MSRLACGALAALCSGVALGAEAPAGAGPVSLIKPVTYAAEAPVPDWIRRDCHLQEQVLDDLQEALMDKGLGGAVVDAAGQGLALRVTIERVVGQRGGGWSGPKTLTLGIALLQSGQVARTTSQTISTDSLNPLAGTCASLERASSKVSDRVVRWLLPGKRMGAGAIALAASASAMAASAPRD